MLLLDHNISQTKGRKREGRLKSEVALSYPKIRRKGFVPYVTSQDMTNEFVLNLNPKRKKIE